MSTAVLDTPDLDTAVDPSVESDAGLSPEEVRLCPGCGLPEQRWRENLGRGHLAEDGHTYCCSGCAREIGCTCL